MSRRRRQSVLAAIPLEDDHAVLVARVNGAPHGERRKMQRDLVKTMARRMRRELRGISRAARASSQGAAQ